MTVFIALQTGLFAFGIYLALIGPLVLRRRIAAGELPAKNASWIPLLRIIGWSLVVISGALIVGSAIVE